jgi:hypothetical protein
MGFRPINRFTCIRFVSEQFVDCVARKIVSSHEIEKEAKLKQLQELSVGDIMNE